MHLSNQYTDSIMKSIWENAILYQIIKKSRLESSNCRSDTKKQMRIIDSADGKHWFADGVMKCSVGEWNGSCDTQFICFDTLQEVCAR